MKRLALICWLWIPFSLLQGQVFNPAFSLTPFLATPLYRLDAESGIYALSGPRLTVGFEFSNEFRLKGHSFLRAGLRYSAFQTTISGLNQIEVVQDKPDPLIWTRRYGSVTLPVSWGRNFCTRKGRNCKLALGGSAGFFLTNYERGEINKNVTVNINNNDVVSISLYSAPNFPPPQLVATVEASASWQPFLQSSRFHLGPTFGFQLNWVEAGRQNGVTQNVTQNLTYEYVSTLRQRFFSAGLTATYHLRKQPNCASATSNSHP